MLKSFQQGIFNDICVLTCSFLNLYIYIYTYVNHRHIYLEDLMRFMQEEEAVKTMSLFEGSKENGRISKSSLKNWVVCDLYLISNDFILQW